MCYGEPELKAKDKVWKEDSDGYDSEIEHLIQVNKEITTESEVCYHLMPWELGRAILTCAS